MYVPAVNDAEGSTLVAVASDADEGMARDLKSTGVPVRRAVLGALGVAVLVVVAVTAVAWKPRSQLLNAAETAVVSQAEELCSSATEDCTKTQCCSVPGHQCFAKNDFWASCLPSCTPGIRDGKAWSCAVLPKAPAPIPRMSWQDAEVNARKLVSGMKQEDKLMLTHGGPGGLGYAGYIGPKNQWAAWGAKGATPLKMNDGPQGFNGYQKVHADESTQLPAAISIAATFDPEASKRYATVVAEEFKAKGANVLLGPDIEVSRAPLAARTFESMSGEDPFLGSSLVTPYISVISDYGIIATIKHWLNNNQEIYRQTMNVEVGDRAQYEIYMPVFKAAIDAGAGAVMCSYNKVYGHHACENKKLLKTLLRGALNFKGYVVSDWGATHNAINSANNGLDVEMPNDKHFKYLPKLIKQGKVPAAALDDMAVHVVTAMYKTGHFAKQSGWGGLDANAKKAAHLNVARQQIFESSVLLKNDDSTLPLKIKGKKIALVGAYCNQIKDKRYLQGDVYSAGGSGYVLTNAQVTPLKGIREHFKDAAKVTWSKDASSGKGADVVVICASAHAEEGWDRANLTLPEVANLTKDLLAQPGHKKIVVMAMVPGAITTEWIDKVDAALLLWMPGEQVGPAIARLLVGDASPSGRLPVSFPKVGEKRFEKREYPGMCPAPKYWCEHMTAHFAEGVLTGYRWNDAKGVPSAFAFGYGLTYTTFKFKNFQAHYANGVATVSLTVSNVGPRDGAAVPQVYVGFESLKPVVRQLRGYKKVLVGAGQDVDVSITLGHEDWSYYDEAKAKWVSATDKGECIIVSVGSSSADLDWHKTLAGDNCQAQMELTGQTGDDKSSRKLRKSGEESQGGAEGADEAVVTDATEPHSGTRACSTFNAALAIVLAYLCLALQ